GTTKQGAAPPTGSASMELLESSLVRDSLSATSRQAHGAFVETARFGPVARAFFEIRHCSPVERILRDPLILSHSSKQVATGTRSAQLPDCDGSIQGDHWPRCQVQERIVQIDNPLPIRLLDRRCDRVLAGNARLEVPTCELGSR